MRWAGARDLSGDLTLVGRPGKPNPTTTALGERCKALPRPPRECGHGEFFAPEGECDLCDHDWDFLIRAYEIDEWSRRRPVIISYLKVAP